MNTYSKDFLEIFGTLSDGELLGEELKHEVSRIIRRIRKEKNMSQKKFAEFMGVNQSMVSKWESFSYNFSLESLGEVFAKLNKKVTISTNDLYDQYSKFVPKYESRQLNFAENLELGA